MAETNLQRHMYSDVTEVLEKIKQAELVQFADIDINGPRVRSPLSGETPLHIVAIWGDVDAAIALLDAGAEIDVPGEEDYTPLHEAIGQGHFAMVELLVLRGASLNLECRGGNALRLASLGENKNIDAFIRRRQESAPPHR